MNRRKFFKLLAGAAVATALKPLIPKTNPERAYIDPTVMNVFNASASFPTGAFILPGYEFGVPSECTRRWERWF
jgi:hypothetical protein